MIAPGPAPRRGRHLKYALLIALTLGLQLLIQRGPWSSPEAACRFALGFAQLRAQLGPATVGTCLGNEAFDSGAGDTTQPTVRGLLVWRRADGGTAFSDGHRTWVAGPYGLQQRLNTERFCWETGAVPGRCLRPDSGGVGAPARQATEDVALLAGALAETVLHYAQQRLESAWSETTLTVARALTA